MESWDFITQVESLLEHDSEKQGILQGNQEKATKYHATM